MEFKEITKKEYDKFFNKSKYNHFLQTSAWAETCRIRKQTPVYLALFDDNNKIIAATAATRKDLPFNLCYFYASRGFLIDWEDYDLLEKFTKHLKDYLKKVNAINFRIDPGVVYQEIDEDANPIEGGFNNYKLFDKLVSLGYLHRGFTKLFERNEPRFTFRINTKRPLEEIEKSLNKTYLKTIKRSYTYDLEVTNEYSTETFFSLMKDIANRNNFNGNPKTFYENFDKNFRETDNVHYITIKVYPDKIISKAQEELTKVNKDLEDGKINEKHMADTKNIIARLEKDIETFTPYKDNKEGLTILTLICPKTDRAMWTLYIGNNSLAPYTFAVNRAYYEAIKYAQEHEFEFLDLFGTIGDPHTEVKNYAGIHEYKRKMGGTYTEFIGEFDIVNKKLWYKIMPTAMKVYRKLQKLFK